MADTSEEAHTTGVIQTWGEHHKEVVEKEWFVIEVKLETSIVKLNVGNLCDDIFEVVLFPSFCGMSHHGEDSIVILLVFVVEEHQF